MQAITKWSTLVLLTLGVSGCGFFSSPSPAHPSHKSTIPTSSVASPSPSPSPSSATVAPSSTVTPTTTSSTVPTSSPTPTSAPPPTSSSPALSSTQIAEISAGDTFFHQLCYLCHGANGQGYVRYLAPKLWGPGNAPEQQGLTNMASLTAFIQEYMPAVSIDGYNPGQLSASEVTDTAAYILHQNGITP